MKIPPFLGKHAKSSAGGPKWKVLNGKKEAAKRDQFPRIIIKKENNLIRSAFLGSPLLLRWFQRSCSDSVHPLPAPPPERCSVHNHSPWWLLFSNSLWLSPRAVLCIMCLFKVPLPTLSWVHFFGFVAEINQDSGGKLQRRRRVSKGEENSRENQSSVNETWRITGAINACSGCVRSLFSTPSR